MMKRLMVALLAISAAHVHVFSHGTVSVINTVSEDSQATVAASTEKLSLDVFETNARVEEAKKVAAQTIQKLKAERATLKEELCIPCISSALRKAKSGNGKLAVAHVANVFTLGIATPVVVAMHVNAKDNHALIKTLEAAEAKKAMRLKLQEQLDILNYSTTDSAFAHRIAIEILHSVLESKLASLKAQFCCQSMKRALAKKAVLENALVEQQDWIKEVEAMIAEKQILKDKIAALKSQVSTLAIDGAWLDENGQVQCVPQDPQVEIIQAQIQELKAEKRALDGSQRDRLDAVACVRCKQSALAKARKEVAAIEKALAENAAWMVAIDAATKEKEAILEQLAQLAAEFEALMNEEIDAPAIEWVPKHQILDC